MQIFLAYMQKKVYLCTQIGDKLIQLVLTTYVKRLLEVILVAGVMVGCQRTPASFFHQQPVTRVAVTSCTHVGFIDALGELDKVVAVCNKDLIYTPLSDSVIDLGDAMSPNIERLLQAHVDVVFVSSYTQDKVAAQMKRLGLRVVDIHEWQESSPLQRTAWITTFGDVLGCRERADSIYQSVVARYDTLAASVLGVQGRMVMAGNDFRGTWYVPSGNTFMGKLFLDAGAQYAFYDDDRLSSIPLTMEKALLTFRDAEVWVGVNARTLAELKAMDKRYAWLRAYQTGNVYNWLAQSTPSGANNFWERGVVHPDEILKDLIEIVHPTGHHRLIYSAKVYE